MVAEASPTAVPCFLRSLLTDVRYHGLVNFETLPRGIKNSLVCTGTGISPSNVLARHTSDICRCRDGGYVRITRRLLVLDMSLCERTFDCLGVW